LYESFVAQREEQVFEKKQVQKGLMHKLLGVPEDKKISDVYASSRKLAKDLLQAVKDAEIVPTEEVRSKATSMLAFAANWPNDGDGSIFDKALKSIPSVEIAGVPKS
jgi:nitrogen regulatory protein PII